MPPWVSSTMINYISAPITSVFVTAWYKHLSVPSVLFFRSRGLIPTCTLLLADRPVSTCMQTNREAACYWDTFSGKIRHRALPLWLRTPRTSNPTYIKAVCLATRSLLLLPFLVSYFPDHSCYLHTLNTSLQKLVISEDVKPQTVQSSATRKEADADVDL